MKSLIYAWLALAVFVSAGAARADHPLLTEDTAVLGQGNWQLELHGERAHSRSEGVTTRSMQPAVVLGYGLTPSSDVEAEITYAREGADDGTGRSLQKGVRDTLIAWKWRFHESGPISLLLRPSLSFPTGADERGFGSGRASWGSDLVAAYETRAAMFLLHLGYQRNRNALEERAPLWHVSGAVLWCLTETVTLALDHGRDTHPDPAVRSRLRRTSFGAWYAVTRDFDVGFGVGTRNGALENERSMMASTKLRW